MKRSNTADRPGGPYGTRTQPEAGAEPTRTQPRGRSRCRALAAAARAPKAACHLSAAFSLTLLLPPPPCLSSILPVPRPSAPHAFCLFFSRRSSVVACSTCTRRALLHRTLADRAKPAWLAAPGAPLPLSGRSAAAGCPQRGLGRRMAAPRPLAARAGLRRHRPRPAGPGAARRKGGRLRAASSAKREGDGRARRPDRAPDSPWSSEERSAAASPPLPTASGEMGRGKAGSARTLKGGRGPPSPGLPTDEAGRASRSCSAFFRPLAVSPRRTGASLARPGARALLLGSQRCAAGRARRSSRSAVCTRDTKRSPRAVGKSSLSRLSVCCLLCTNRPTW